MGMNITSDYEDEDSEEEIPETMDVHQESMSKRADRMEQNKQAMLSSFIIEHLRAHMPLNTKFQRVCRVSASPNVRFGRRGGGDIYCYTCACTAGQKHLKATQYVDLKTCRLLHPVELEEATGLRYLPLEKSCPRCQHCQWERTAVAGKETVTIEIDGIWRYAAANYCCAQCEYRFEYTDPLSYITTTHLPGKPVIARIAVSVEAIEFFITTQRHEPHHTPTAFINCRLPDSRVSLWFALLMPMLMAAIGRVGCWLSPFGP